MFKGSLTALITPFKDGLVDEKAFQDIVEWQIQEGTSALVPCGTTGESPTLSKDEHIRVIELCAEVTAGRVPVIAGCGSNSTAQTIELAAEVKRVGADAMMLVAPYYNKPSQDGLFQHFKAVHDAVDLPLVIYNIPGRTGVDISVDTLSQLNDACDRFIALKDATGDLARVAYQRDALGHGFSQLSGEDMTAVGFNAMGGKGCISVTANVAPRLCANMQAASLSGNYEEALRIHDQLAPLHDAMFLTSNPVPVKAAANLIGLCEADVRLPLTGLNEALAAIVASAVVHAKLRPIVLAQ